MVDSLLKANLFFVFLSDCQLKNLNISRVDHVEKASKPQKSNYIVLL